MVVTGAPTALYALGPLRTPDGVDQVMLPAGDPGPAMTSSYNVEQIGQMPEMLFQSIRLGTFTQIFPYRPGQTLTAGQAFDRRHGSVVEGAGGHERAAVVGGDGESGRGGRGERVEADA